MDKEEKAGYKVWLLQFKKCTDMGAEFIFVGTGGTGGRVKFLLTA